MTNINPFQFINNFISGYNNSKTAKTQNFAIIQNNQNENAVIKESARNVMPKTMQQLSMITTELAKLENQQIIDMLKQLLNMPKNFEQLLKQLVVNMQESDNKNVLILLAATLNTEQLSELLQTNSKEALSKLYQMLAQFNKIGVSLKDEQISEISKLISFVSAAALSEPQTIRATMLMYLPWLPLTDNNMFKLDIASKETAESVEVDDFVTILITTQNFGNFKAEIIKTNNDEIKIILVISDTFPLKTFEILMKEDSKKYNVNINIDTEIEKNFNKETIKQEKIQISVNVSSKVNPFLLLISNALIKNVHTVDEKQNLINQRKEKLDNGKNKN